MGSEQPSTFYDQAWQDRKWRGHWRSVSRVRAKLYEKAAGLVGHDVPEVVDIGCGAGHFCQALHEINPPEMYLGYDFSAVAISRAKARCPSSHFIQADANKLHFGTLTPGSVVVAMEFLEHITDDLGILARIPEGTTVIISVPSFDDQAHVRCFKDWPDVVRRYGHLLDMKNAERHTIWKWFILKTKRSSHGTAPKQVQTGLF